MDFPVPLVKSGVLFIEAARLWKPGGVAPRKHLSLHTTINFVLF